LIDQSPREKIQALVESEFATTASVALPAI
jgi:hypothetical protein